MELLDSFIFITIIKAAVIFAVLMTTLAYLQWVERKVIAHVQVAPVPTVWGRMAFCSPWPTSSSSPRKTCCRPT
jgi:NADH-quinone oxidoreductase subunit H